MKKIYRVIRKILLIVLPDKYVIFRGSKKLNVLYLTFDDGPNDVYTDKILNVLNENSVRATFFLVGDYLANKTDLTNRIYEHGHFICNHSVTHNDFVHLDTDSQVQSIKELNNVFDKIGFEEKRFFRPPRGDLKIGFIFKMLKENIPIAMWSYDSYDYKNLSATQMISRFEKKPVRNGEVILFHDDNENTVEALSMLIPYWKEKGFDFKSLRNMN